MKVRNDPDASGEADDGRQHVDGERDAARVVRVRDILDEQRIRPDAADQGHDRREACDLPGPYHPVDADARR